MGPLGAAAGHGAPATLTDKGYTGAGIGIMVPTKGHDLAGRRAPAARTKPRGEAAVLARAIESGLGPGAGRRDISARLAALEGAGVHPNPVEAGMTADYPPPEV